MHADIHDHSTFVGQIHKILYRWKYTLLALAAAGAIGIVYVALNAEDLFNLGEDDTTVAKFLLKNGEFVYHGNSSKFEDRHFDPFPGLASLTAKVSGDPQSVTAMELKWVKISTGNFSQELTLFANLENLRLENVTFDGLLQYAKLPKLKSLFISQGSEPEDETDYRIINEATPWLKSTMFFLDPTSNSNSTDFYELMATQPLDYLSIFLKGSVTYLFDKINGEIRLSLPRCRTILDTINFPYKKVTLGLCGDLQPTSLSPNVTYLNLYITYTKINITSAIIRNLPNLKQFYAELPGGKSLNLSDFHPSLETLSVSSIRLNVPNGLVMPAVKEFHFGSENQYGWFNNDSFFVTDLSENIIRNFSMIFPAVETVGIFELGNSQRYVYLGNVLDSTAKLIVCENFPRNNSLTLTGRNKEVEELLRAIGVPENEKNFIIEKRLLSGWKGRSLTYDEFLIYRYRFLGWDAIDSFPKFYYVRGIIEAGGILGQN